MHAQSLGLITGVAILILVIDLIRRQKMTFKYSLAWIVASFTLVFFSIFDKLLYQLSRLAGFELPSNFVFFVLLVFFILVSLFLTIYVNEQNVRSESLAQSVALLEYRIKKLQDQLQKK
jgi:hypothetical protein